jgi:uncharacterized LabA/DUF88 family protein
MNKSGDELKINIAYIDAANLDRALRDLNWKLDYKSFRVWLSDKYKIKRAYIFIGLIPKYKDLYTYFQECGFTIVFKEVVYQGNGTPKGNCDTDLIMQAIDDAYEGRLEKALLVSSDGDYAPLVKKLQTRQQFLGILSPASAKKCSILLKRTDASIAYINDQRKLLAEIK